MDEELRERVTGLLARMQRPVTARVWPKPENEASDALMDLLSGLAEAVPLFSVEEAVGEPPTGGPAPLESSVMELYVNDRPTGIRYLGFPSGYEFGALLETVLAVSTNLPPSLPGSLVQPLAASADPVVLQVFVTPTCPYCPRAVRLAQEFARALPAGHLTAEMVDTTAFEHMALKAGVRGVPMTLINGRLAVMGVVSPAQMAEAIREALTRPPRPA